VSQEQLPSLLDARDGETIQPEYRVPGIGHRIRMSDGGFGVHHIRNPDGTVSVELTRELLDRFGYEQVTASTLRRVGEWLIQRVSRREFPATLVVAECASCRVCGAEVPAGQRPFCSERCFYDAKVRGVPQKPTTWRITVEVMVSEEDAGSVFERPVKVSW
jgi:hypothetical protein